MKLFMRHILVPAAALLLSAALPASGLCQAGPPEEYTIQVMSNVDKKLADTLCADLIKKGHQARIDEKTDSDGSVLYKVRIGRFTTKTEALQHVASINLGGLQYWIAAVEAAASTSTVTAEPAAAEAAPVTEEVITETAPAPPASQKSDNPAPARAERTYKYYDSDGGVLHVTNAYQSIPEHLRSAIKEIAVFPVAVISYSARDMRFMIDMEGSSKQVVLDDVTALEAPLPAKAVQDFDAYLKQTPVRIKYDPSRMDGAGALHGSLYLKNGTPVSTEMVRRGLAACNAEKMLPFQKKACAEAEQEARSAGAGAWSK